MKFLVYYVSIILIITNNITNNNENDSNNNIHLEENSEPNLIQVSRSNSNTTVSNININSVSDNDNYSIDNIRVCNYHNIKEWNGKKFCQSQRASATSGNHNFGEFNGYAF
ncbi:hypothetical protein PIROE2DRAFT_4873 [Piromyces sp. E2]|nr:hypothetical protein PIROE2DRAFT_4873 [Piromyces sp. E2]|eukprot:OUM67589.1 hypothetical protein PIROE2DRAFT_4873 [Piromyces sp. E2]